MRILRYARQTEIGPGVTFDIVPEQEVTEDHAMFEAVLGAVRESGLTYVVIERTERLIEQGPPQPPQEEE